MSDYDSGYMDGKAVMYERIAELEAERDATFNKGMERAAEIAESCSHDCSIAANAIRKVIEK